MSSLEAAPTCDPALHREDQVLVDLLLRGDSGAWRRFIETHGRLVRSRVADVATIFGLGRDDSAIDDAAAEVFAALLGNDAAALRAFAGRSSLGTYVAVIATRSAMRCFAQQCRGPDVASDSELRQAPDAVKSDPVHDLIRCEQHQRLNMMLERLPQKQQTLVRLFHLQEKSYVEINQLTQIPIGSIGPTLRRAEAKLKQWMLPDGGTS